jgi:hypothetical protein
VHNAEHVDLTRVVARIVPGIATSAEDQDVVDDSRRLALDAYQFTAILVDQVDATVHPERGQEDRLACPDKSTRDRRLRSCTDLGRHHGCHDVTIRIGCDSYPRLESLTARPTYLGNGKLGGGDGI